ncbi:hypothetical protein HAP93_02180 [Acidithiobacillus ferriphilus]|uniref:hypothetical protein n=1 Tax=Acidithiobacillus ferriphilus TaxID=1689834 RepID=UPI001C060456|nr:hypothetical protein [Acidithiobacillus ferriphilus]MBU2784582.1 hypothetical protein [Acidithiobacillus ferriphilus]
MAREPKDPMAQYRRLLWIMNLVLIYIAGLLVPLMAYGIGYVLLRLHVATVPHQDDFPFNIMAMRLFLGFSVIFCSVFLFFIGLWLRYVCRAAKIEARKSIE